MDTRCKGAPRTVDVFKLAAVLLLITACAPPTTSGPTPLPTLALGETGVTSFAVPDFDTLHERSEADANKYLILGNLPIAKAAADLPGELAALLGRWEGYSYAPPVKKDRKLVLVIRQIDAREGRATGWTGTNLQFPDAVGEIRFRVTASDPGGIEFQISWPGGQKEVDAFTYDPEKKVLRGWAKNPADGSTSGPFELNHERSFYVYKDYAGYLSGRRIYAKSHANGELQQYGAGYLVYLPQGYEDDPHKTWPLILFLHGSGDRGDNLLLLAKASPFMYIREKGPLPCIIVAPLLSGEGYPSFPEAYLDGVLAEAQATYRVDAKRIYVTGLSMGGEATYRFALHKPQTFAAIVPLSAYISRVNVEEMKSIKDLPIWAIHGAEDSIVPLAAAQHAVDALKAAGNQIRFTVLAGHDHDVWTDTYSDPAFYDWLLLHQKP